MSKSKETVAKYVLAIDLGTGTCQLAVLTDGKPQVLQHAGETSFPTAVFRNADGKIFVGDAANRRAYKDPANYFANFKTAMKADELVSLSADGDFTVIDAFAATFKHLLNVSLQVMPYLAGFPQFGGNKCPAKDLRIAVTIPAVDFGLTQVERYKEALNIAGLDERFVEDVAFFKEPYAASHEAFSERNRRGILMTGDVIAVVDIGAGTTDITISEFRGGQLHAKAAHSGLSDLGGSNLTAAVAEVIGEKLGIPFVAFTRGIGLSFDLEGMDAKQREEQFGIWQAAKDVKHQLCLSESAFATVATSTGNREVEFEVAELGEGWIALCREIEDAISNALGDSGLTWPDVKYVVAAGGGSKTRGVHEIIARGTNRPTSEVLYCSEPQHAIVAGAVRMGHNIGDVTTAVDDTWGMTYPDATTGRNANQVFIVGGELVPPIGLDVEKMNTKVVSNGGKQRLNLYPFIAKPNVIAQSGDLIADSETVPLVPVEVELDLPAGEHPVLVRFRFDVTGKAMVVLSFPTLPDMEVVAVSLSIDKDGTTPEFAVVDFRVVVLFDSSGSMRGKPIQEARDATVKFVEANMAQEIECALIRFGGKPKVKFEGTTDAKAAREIIESIPANAGTAMAKGLRLATKMATPDKKTIAVMFSDGYPQSRGKTLEAAIQLRERAELYTIAIGNKADAALLKQLASSPQHFIPVGRSSDLSIAFETISTLIYTGGTPLALPSNTPEQEGRAA